jgi:Dolichyl-phosphate-mannose-protein mannosyltransferase
MTSPLDCTEKEYQVPSSASSTLSNSIKYVVILLLSSFTAFILQPRIGVRDEDAYSYIVGAYSIQAGMGYCDLSGSPLNHWPPGYSLILSLFPSPMQGALFLNYLSFGVAVVLIYQIARNSKKWTELSALGLALALGFIFLRRHASNAAPDILTYALFLFALFLYYKDSSRLRMISYLIWGLLIPIKLIAVVFIPAALLARYVGKPMTFIRAERFELFIAFVSWSFFLVITLLFNFLTIRHALPNSHTPHATNGDSLLYIASLFLMNIPRTFLSNWYGSIGTMSALIPFCAVLLVALVCLFTLRFHSRDLAKHAILLFLLCCLPQFVTQQVGGIRLAGYGLIVLFFALYPAGGWYKMWALYGLLGVALSVLNALTQNSLGANDPRYEKLAHESLQVGPFPGKVHTNSFHVLDIHTKVATEHVDSAEQLSEAEYFFWVSLPKYDAIAGTVSPVEMPGEGWCEVASVTGAKLFRRCTQTNGPASIEVR